MNQFFDIFQHMGKRAKIASQELIQLTEEEKNKILLAIADRLESNADEILAVNELDMKDALTNQIPTIMLDRLKLTVERIQQIADGVRQVVELEDPTGRVLEVIERPNGLHIEKRCVPLGVIAIIFEARPNVTVDASVLSFKTGNATILRGGKEAFRTNQCVVKIIRDAIADNGANPDAIQLVEVLDREAVGTLLSLREYIDVVIPRGGAGLIQRVVQDSAIPVIETGSGICHTYVDETADLQMALEIAINAKVQRPSVCNSMETLLVNQSVADTFLPMLEDAMKERNVRIHGDERIQQDLANVIPLVEDSFATEYNDLDLNVRVVDSLEAAIQHINQYSTHHSECIVTSNEKSATEFLNRIDAATVYWNASTRFTDGFEFGFGAEIGISTQKLHARGPMGLPALTSIKYIVTGTGQVRG